MGRPVWLSERVIQRVAAELRGRSVVLRATLARSADQPAVLRAPLQGCILVGTPAAHRAPGSALMLVHHRLNPLHHHIGVHRDQILAEGADTA